MAAPARGDDPPEPPAGPAPDAFAFASPWGRPLAGRTALVTGAGRGIGLGVAQELAAAGAQVIAADVDAGTASRTAASLGAAAAGHFQVDVADAGSVARLVESVRAAGERIDILANVAGVISMATVADLQVADWDRVMNVNARGTFLVAKAVLPAMIEAGAGAIINISSAAGKDGVAGGAHYSSSKFAVVGFTQSLAKEVAQFGIRVNAVCPGVVPTQMIADVGAAWEMSTEQMVAEWQLIKRPQEAREIGAAVVFLAVMTSMTGQSINVDGGSIFH
jgi:meso-butanediol dehydrogenase / (S,S)-butanediol dehydrogenase / diacetyl reductase